MDQRDYWAQVDSEFEFNESKGLLRVTISDDEDGEDREIELRAQYQVCDLCDGLGRHVNPSIDAHGISSQEFAEDPEFAEEYFAGRYDQTCNKCKGKRVYPEIDHEYYEHNSSQDYLSYISAIEEDARYASEREAERRMGC